MKTFEEWLEHVKEGLIRTHNIIQSENQLKFFLNTLNVNFELTINSKLSFELKINHIIDKSKLYNPFNEDVIEIIIDELINVYGYLPVYCDIVLLNGQKNRIKWHEFKFYNNIKQLTIRFEAKYEDGLYKNDVECPDLLYHVTNVKNTEKILKIGLYPKTNHRRSNYSSRVYLFTNKEDYNKFIKQFKINDLENLKYNSKEEYDKFVENNKYSLLEISTKNELILHTDPNSNGTYYTYDNISPKQIKIIKTDI